MTTPAQESRAGIWDEVRGYAERNGPNSFEALLCPKGRLLLKSPTAFGRMAPREDEAVLPEQLPARLK
jgi:hypothetical protein